MAAENKNIEIHLPDLVDKAPRVSSILGVLSKPALIPWAAKITAQYMRDELLDLIKHGLMTYEEFMKIDTDELYKKAKIYHQKMAAEEGDKGKKTHAAIEKFIRAKADEDIEIEATIEKPFSAFLDWWEENYVVPVLVEQRVYCSDGGGYSGRPDLLAYLKEKGKTTLCLIDFKTGRGVYDDHFLQLCAYYFAIKESTELEPDRGQIIRLDKVDGFPEFYKYERPEIYKGHERFLCLVDYYHKTYGVKKIKEDDWM